MVSIVTQLCDDSFILSSMILDSHFMLAQIHVGHFTSFHSGPFLVICRLGYVLLGFVGHLMWNIFHVSCIFCGWRRHGVIFSVLRRANFINTQSSTDIHGVSKNSNFVRLL